MRLVLTNVPPAHAERIARTVVEERLAACVNAFPVQSTYAWKGALSVDAEQTLLLKVAADGVEALRARLLELHPYELPEVVVLAVDVGASHEAYVNWVREGSRGNRG